MENSAKNISSSGRREVLKGIVGTSVALQLAPISCAGTNKDSFDDLEPIPWKDFIGRQDMVWDKVPKIWEQAPYLGNGMLGVMIFQGTECAANELSIHIARGDYYDNRPPHKGNPNIWINRARLPVGFYRLKSSGNIVSVDWRLDLWNAVLRGRVVTAKGSYQFEAYVHSQYDSFYFEAKSDAGESITLEWQPLEAYSHARKVCERGMKHAETTNTKPQPLYVGFTSTPYEKAPAPTTHEEPLGHFCQQLLFGNCGELITGWNMTQEGSTIKLYGTIQFSVDLNVSLVKARDLLNRTKLDLAKGTYYTGHTKWWNEFYELSYVSLDDAFWEQFYWLQMYKFASATRSDGMFIDVFGPWYQPGFWPMIWTDLNAQLTYWTHLTSNRLSVGESLLNQMDRYTPNLIKNVHPDWQAECLNADTIFPADMNGPCGKKIPDHMVWLLHNYWLHCVYADDAERMKNGLFPLLRRAVNTYLYYIKENPDKTIKDGRIHTFKTWSPEYPNGTGTDINYTLSLIRWSCTTLLDLNREFALNDPLATQWKNLLDNLAPYPVDDNGMKIGRDIPFAEAHRHYSHLLAFYPLCELSPEKEADLLRKSLEHWLKTNLDTGKNHSEALAVTGYTCTGAASMYALLRQGNEALRLLDRLPHSRVSCTTMYSEGNPVIESPFSAATSIHDMFLQSWDKRIRILPAVPDSWRNLQFRSLRAQGGVLVTADRKDGKTIYVKIDSPKKKRRIEFRVEIDKPKFVVINAKGKRSNRAIQQNAEGFFVVELEADSSLRIYSQTDARPSLPIKSNPADANIFGHNKRYEEIIKARMPEDMRKK